MSTDTRREVCHCASASRTVLRETENSPANCCSDGSAAWRAGGDYPVALIGPGVEASHAYERTHLDALRDTAALILAYVR